MNVKMEIPKMVRTVWPRNAKTRSKPKATEVAVLHACSRIAGDIFWVRPMKIGTLPRASVIMNKATMALTKSLASNFEKWSTPGF